jgi:hypothetical protein
MTARLPPLMDCSKIARETGLPESTCRRIMRRCELLHFEGVRKVYVRRSELLEKLRTVPQPKERT